MSIILVMAVAVLAGCAKGADDSSSGVAAAISQAPTGCTPHSSGWHHFCGTSIVSDSNVYYCGIVSNEMCFYYEHAADGSDPVPRTETRCTPINQSNTDCP